MDGRVGAIRRKLDENSFQDIAIFAYAALGRSLALGNIGSVVKLLSEQAKSTPGVGGHDQAVMALVTSPPAVANLAELIVQ